MSVQGVQPVASDNAAALWQVAPAQAGQAVVGVVAGRAELLAADEHLPSETGRQLVPRDGGVAPGHLVTIVYSGPMQVRLQAGSSADPGARVTAASEGSKSCLNASELEELSNLANQLRDGLKNS